jgi:hypothetical protein
MEYVTEGLSTGTSIECLSVSLKTNSRALGANSRASRNLRGLLLPRSLSGVQQVCLRRPRSKHLLQIYILHTCLDLISAFVFLVGILCVHVACDG